MEFASFDSHFDSYSGKISDNMEGFIDLISMPRKPRYVILYFNAIFWMLLLFTNISSLPREDRGLNLLSKPEHATGDDGNPRPGGRILQSGTSTPCKNPQPSGQADMQNGCNISTPHSQRDYSMPTAATSNSSSNRSTPRLSNITNHNATVGRIISLSDKLAIFCFSCTLVFGVFGNLFVCYTFGYKSGRRRTVTETLLLYLAIVDLISSLINPCLFIYWIATGFIKWHFGKIACKIFPPIGPISTTASASIIVLICIDRYRSIVTPFKSRLSIYQVNIITIGIVVVSIVSYTYYIASLVVMPGIGCVAPRVKDPGFLIPNVTVMVLFDLLYITVFVLANVRIFRHLRASELLRSRTSYWESRERGARKVMRVLFAVGLIFAILVFPRDIFYLTVTVSWIFPPGILSTPLVFELNYWFKFLQVSNSCANIFIYSQMHDKFKHELKQLFTKCFSKSGSLDTANEPTDKGTGFSIESSETSFYHRKTSMLQKLMRRDKSSPSPKGRRQDQRSKLSVNNSLVRSDGNKHLVGVLVNNDDSSHGVKYSSRETTVVQSGDSIDEEQGFVKANEVLEKIESAKPSPSNLKTATPQLPQLDTNGFFGNGGSFETSKTNGLQPEENIAEQPYLKYQAKKQEDVTNVSHFMQQFSKSKLFGVADAPIGSKRRLPTLTSGSSSSGGSSSDDASESKALLELDNSGTDVAELIKTQHYNGTEIAKKLSRERKCGFKTQETNL